MSATPALQDQVAHALALQRDGDVGGTAADAREKATVFMAVEIAMRHPRDEAAAAKAVLAACQTPEFAEVGVYKIPRKNRKTGKTEELPGPSVHLAREMKRRWGNFRSGVEVLSIGEDEIVIQGWAWDLESNNYTASPQAFKRKIWKFDYKAKETSLQDANDDEVRNLVNRFGAFCERNALLHLMPRQVVDAAVEACVQTQLRAAKELVDGARSNKGDGKAKMADTIDKLLKFFATHGVDRRRIQEHLACVLEDMGARELTELRQAARSLKDGTATADDLFPPDEFTDTTTDQPAAPTEAADSTPTADKDPFQ